MNSEKTSFGKPDKKKMQVTQQIFHNLLEIVELYPKYSLPQHLAAILRSKGGKEYFFWKEEELLKRIEQHKSEMESESILESSNDDALVD
jgi:hypothetical protein